METEDICTRSNKKYDLEEHFPTLYLVSRIGLGYTTLNLYLDLSGIHSSENWRL